MSVNSKMTALADEIRVLSGTTEDIGLDAMTERIGDANDEVASQVELLTQVVAALEGKAGGSVETVIGTISTTGVSLEERPVYYLDKNLHIQCVDAFAVSSIEVVKNSIISIPGGAATNVDSNITPVHYTNVQYNVFSDGYVTGDFYLIISS